MLFIDKESDIQIKEKYQCLYFYAPWVPYNKKMLTMIAKTEKLYGDIAFLAIDTDNFKNLCRRFNIDSIPTILIFKDGKEIKRINGIILTSAFNSIFNDICNIRKVEEI